MAKMGMCRSSSSQVSWRKTVWTFSSQWRAAFYWKELARKVVSCGPTQESVLSTVPKMLLTWMIIPVRMDWTSNTSVKPPAHLFKVLLLNSPVSSFNIFISILNAASEQGQTKCAPNDGFPPTNPSLGQLPLSRSWSSGERKESPKKGETMGKNERHVRHASKWWVLGSHLKFSLKMPGKEAFSWKLGLRWSRWIEHCEMVHVILPSKSFSTSVFFWW